MLSRKSLAEDFVQSVLDKHGVHLDAKKVLKKIGGKRPGKRCKGGWISAEKQCSDHKTSDGKLTEAGKSSAAELAVKVRSRKGMPDRTSVTRKRLAGLDDRIEAEQKATIARKTATTQARRKGEDTEAWLNRLMGKDKKQESEPVAKPKRSKEEKELSDLLEKRTALQMRQMGRYRDGTATRARATTNAADTTRINDRIEYLRSEIKKQKASEPKPQIAPSQLNAGDRKQAVQYNEQGAARAKAEGRSGDASAWQREAQKARISNVKSAQRQANTTQSELFGIEETTDLPLFRKRKDSDRWNAAVDRIEAKYGIRFDRAIAGGKSKPRSNRTESKCSAKSHKCGTVCVPLKSRCRKGDLGNAQERLKKLRKVGADDLTIRKAKTSLVERTSVNRKAIDEKRISGLRDRLKRSVLSGTRESEGLAELDPSSIDVDPKRFQYKIIGEHTATGSVGSLTGVRKYDPNLAGILQVWKDPDDGKTYVVNGHNRLDLAKKLGADSVAVRYLKAPSAKAARAIGALTNIAEGRGDALDAAKFFRDTGISKEDLSAKGIPMREKIATDGLALSKLDDSLFRRTIDGDIPMNRAAIVGGSGLDHASQRDLMKLVDKEAKRKNLTDGAISEMVDIAKSSQVHQESTLSLFGEETVTKSNMIEKAKLQSAIKQRLSREKNLFGTVSRGRAADELSRGGNTIDKAKSGEISTNADRALKQFDQMKNLSGHVSDAINRAASRMASGESQKSVEKDLYAEISSIDIFGNRQRRAA